MQNRKSKGRICTSAPEVPILVLLLLQERCCGEFNSDVFGKTFCQVDLPSISLPYADIPHVSLEGPVYQDALVSSTSLEPSFHEWDCISITNVPPKRLKHLILR